MIGATVEAQLDTTLWGLLAGEVELTDLTPALAAWWTVAFDTGRAAACEDAHAPLRWDRDVWYFVANSPGKRPGDFYTHATDELWRVGE